MLTLTGVTQSKIGDVYLLASERSERDTIRGTQSRFRYNWRASVASETLTGVTQIENRGYLFIYLFVYMFGRTYVILYFDLRDRA